jgi:hypothetical protein
MYIAPITLILIVSIVMFKIWRSEKESKADLHLINVIMAVEFIIKNIDQGNLKIENSYRYAFLLQYLIDMHNFNIKDLNQRWEYVYNFLNSMSNIEIKNSLKKYSVYGRLHPEIILKIADMYEQYSRTVGKEVWRESNESAISLLRDSFNSKGLKYINNVKDLFNAINIYDTIYTGHVLQAKRKTSNNLNNLS